MFNSMCFFVITCQIMNNFIVKIVSTHYFPPVYLGPLYIIIIIMYNLILNNFHSEIAYTFHKQVQRNSK